MSWTDRKRYIYIYRYIYAYIHMGDVIIQSRSDAFFNSPTTKIQTHLRILSSRHNVRHSVHASTHARGPDDYCIFNITSRDDTGTYGICGG